MRRIVSLIALALIAASCGGNSADEATTTVASAPPTTAAATTTVPSTTSTTTPQPAASGHPLVIAAVDFEAGVVELRNDGSDPYDLEGHWACNRPSYLQVPAQVLAPGETVEVSAGSLLLSADSGELGLYASSDFGSPDAIIRYVQWGSDSHGRTATAVAAGVWTAGQFIDNGGASIVSSGSDPVGAADWSTS